MMVGNMPDKSVDEYKEKVEELTDEEKWNIYSGGESMAEAPMTEFLEHHGLESDFRTDLEQSMLVGYGVGNSRENQQGNAPEIG
ncbi:hypothetical protein ABT147_17045 [Streptomyces sp. NPDC001868]|uniref:hypothetical protein n=1 Tax=Streptomyces sp. NPDC001868 TaxID=3154401 RepID=UPI0033253834